MTRVSEITTQQAEARRRWDRERYARERDKQRERARLYYERNREKKRAYDRMRYRRDRDRIRARVKARGIRKGNIVPRLCRRCGAVASSQRHHYCDSCREWALERRAKSEAARQRERDRQRASTVSRGYGRNHQRLRESWERRFECGEAIPCARCRMLIFPGEPWDLGHDDYDRTQYAGPEHRSCNRAAAGRQRAKRRAARAARATWERWVVTDGDSEEGDGQR